MTTDEGRRRYHNTDKIVPEIIVREVPDNRQAPSGPIIKRPKLIHLFTDGGVVAVSVHANVRNLLPLGTVTEDSGREQVADDLRVELRNAVDELFYAHASLFSITDECSGDSFLNEVRIDLVGMRNTRRRHMLRSLR